MSFIWSTKILMADGSKKNISDIRIGDEVQGHFEEANPVWAREEAALGDRTMVLINGRIEATMSQLFFTNFGWASMQPDVYKTIIARDMKLERITKDRSSKVNKVRISKIDTSDLVEEVIPFGPRCLFHEGQPIVFVLSGRQEIIKHIEILKRPESTPVYSFMASGDHTAIANGFVVSAHPTKDYDYSLGRKKKRDNYESRIRGGRWKARPANGPNKE